MEIGFSSHKFSMMPSKTSSTLAMASSLLLSTNEDMTIKEISYFFRGSSKDSRNAGL